jgi:hypothetical protein
MGQQAGRFNTLNFIHIDWFNKQFILSVSSEGIEIKRRTNLYRAV